MLKSRISKVLRCHPVPRQREWVVAMFFETGDEFAAWLEKHGAGKSELIVGNTAALEPSEKTRFRSDGSHKGLPRTTAFIIE
jgi:hypothetical protein